MSPRPPAATPPSGAEPRDPESLSEALAGLRAEDPRQRARAAKALGRQGPDVASAVPDLLTVLADPDPMVRAVAAGALGRIGAPEAVPGLVAAAADPLPGVRFWCAEALGRLGVRSEAVLALLRRLADEPEIHVQAAARRALAALHGPPG